MHHERVAHFDQDHFFQEGKQIVTAEKLARDAWLANGGHEADDDAENNRAELIEGRERREQLKRDLFDYLEYM